MYACHVALAILVLAIATARAEPMSALLAGVARNARFTAPARADLRIERQSGAETRTVQAVLVGDGTTVYVETRDGARALVHPGKIIVRSGTRLVQAAPGTRFANTDLLLEDLAVFTPGLLRVPQVSDEGPTGVVVTGAPKPPSARVLIVLTIDPAAHVVDRSKYYEGTISNLAAFRRDDEFQDVAGHQRPARIVVEGLRERTSTRIALAWRPAPEVPPELFRPTGLRRPSPITWE